MEIIKDRHCENLRLHILGLAKYENDLNIDVRVHLTSDFVEWLLGEGLWFKGIWNRSKHKHDITINDQPIEVKRLIELKETKTKGKRWVNSIVVNLWSANKIQENETIMIAAFDENGILGFILQGDLTQEACDKGKEKYNRPVEEGKNKGSKISISYEMLKRDSIKIHYANTNAINKHFTNPRKDYPNNLYIKELCLERAKNPLSEVTSFVNQLNHE